MQATVKLVSKYKFLLLSFHALMFKGYSILKSTPREESRAQEIPVLFALTFSIYNCLTAKYNGIQRRIRQARWTY